MRLRIVSPEDRVDRLQFDQDVEYTDHVIHVGGYRCPHCESEREFNTRHLRDSEQSRESPLGPEWDEACTGERPIGRWEWFLDFRCRRCESPVRIIYGHGGESSHSVSRYQLLTVIEAHAPPPRSC